MDRYRQLDDAQPRPQVTAGYRHRFDQFKSQFVSHLPKLILIELSKVCRKPYGIEKRSTIADGHFNTFLQNSQQLAYAAQPFRTPNFLSQMRKSLIRHRKATLQEKYARTNANLF